MTPEPAPTSFVHHWHSRAGARSLAAVGGFWSVGALVGGVVWALNGENTLGPVNVAGLLVAAAATVMWGAVLAYRRHWGLMAASAPLGGLLVTIGVYASFTAVDGMGDPGYPLLTWLFYSYCAAGALLIGAACGAVVLLVVRKLSPP